MLLIDLQHLSTPASVLRDSRSSAIIERMFSQAPQARMAGLTFGDGARGPRAIQRFPLHREESHVRRHDSKH